MRKNSKSITENNVDQSRRDVLKFIGLGAGLGGLAGLFGGRELGIQEILAQTQGRLEVSAYSFTSPADVIVFRDGDYAIALDGKTKQVIARSTDHAEVIQATFNYVPDNSVVYFMANSGGRGGVDLVTMFLIDKPLTVSKGIKIVGAGRNKIYLRPKSTFPDGQPFLKVEPTSNEYIFEMEGMKFHNADETGATKNTWVEISQTYLEVNIFRCEFRMPLHLYQTDRWGSIIETWFYGVDLVLYSRLDHLRVIGCIFDGGGIKGYDVFNTYYGVNRLVLVGNRFTNSTVSISVNRGVINGNVFEFSSLQIVPEAKYVTVVGNTFYDAKYRTIRLWGKVSSDVDTVLIAGNTFYGNGTDTQVISLEYYGTDRCYIYDNVFVNVPSPVIVYNSSGGWNPDIRRNYGYPTENSGVVTVTGDGTTTTFTVDVSHGLVSDKVAVKVALDRDGSIDKIYLVDTDGDGFKETIRIQVTYATAPASGESVPIYWSAEVVG